MMDLINIILAILVMVFLLLPVYIIGMTLSLLMYPVRFAAGQVEQVCEYLLKE
jgi:hypothetical protein